MTGPGPRPGGPAQSVVVLPVETLQDLTEAVPNRFRDIRRRGRPRVGQPHFLFAGESASAGLAKPRLPTLSSPTSACYSPPTPYIQPQQLLPAFATRSHPVDSGLARRPPRYSACAGAKESHDANSTITATSTMESVVTYLFPDLCQKARMPAKSAVYKTALAFSPR